MQPTLLSMNRDGLESHQLECTTEVRVFQLGTLTAQQHIDEILDVHVRLYAGASSSILVDNNACPHTAHSR